MAKLTSYQALQKNAVGQTFVRALTNTTLVQEGQAPNFTYSLKLDLGHLIGNAAFFVAGLAAGDATPNLINVAKGGEDA